MDKRVSVLSGILALLLVISFFFVQRSATQQEPSSITPLSVDDIAQLQAKGEEGSVDAQISLGRAYEDGNGVPKSDPQAVKWYRMAAEQEDAWAQNRLGLMFRSGRGVEADKAEAVKWYKKAARQKYAAAMFNLGTAYYNGDGVGIDDVVACAWFLLAEDFGSQPAGDAVKRMEQEARSLKVDAFEKIGKMYEKGDDLPKSYKDAVNWYRKAAENGAGPVQVKFASLLLQAKGVSANYEEARRFCQKAAEQHYSPGTYCVGLLYQQGLGVAKDPPQAAKWFEEAANMGHAPAMLRLGEMYWKGEGVKQDKISAYEFIAMAFTADLPDAKREKEQLEKELNPKEVKKGQAKAVEWTRTHHPLVLKGSNSAAN
jgi:hypothetical protein